jgi:hypothetical protein
VGWGGVGWGGVVATRVDMEITQVGGCGGPGGAGGGGWGGDEPGA